MAVMTVCPGCNRTFMGTPESLMWKDGICFHCHDPLKRVQNLALINKHEGSYGWIQWKGTNVCMDFHCKYCEAEINDFGHIDADFAYFARCRCGRVYALNGYIELIEVLKDEEQYLPPSVVNVEGWDENDSN